MTSYGEALRKARVAKRITLRQLSEFTKKSIGYLSDIEHGRRRPPDLETVHKMEELLEIKDGSLINMALKLRKSISNEFNELFYKHPKLSDALLRARDEDIEGIIKAIEKGDKSIA
ncbi:MAG: helix-turn-helix transcriptional regulator [Syntrophales bacterium]|jgi:transcriptional regulator with XRE-family HTH domain